jgi:hypothetical protein
MNKVAMLIVYFVATSFAFASLTYFSLQFILPTGFPIFGALFRMFMYHTAHPYQYIGVVSLVYAAIATPMSLRWGHLHGWRLRLLILGVIAATIVVASVPGGMLWKIHDMQAGRFTHGSEFRSDILWGATTGLQIGWFIIAVSIPYNLIGLAIGYFVTRRGFRLAESFSISSTEVP